MCVHAGSIHKPKVLQDSTTLLLLHRMMLANEAQTKLVIFFVFATVSTAAGIFLLRVTTTSDSL
jgi:hypothetical protein